MDVIVLKETKSGFICEHISDVNTAKAKKVSSKGRGKKEAFRKCLHKVKKATKK